MDEPGTGMSGEVAPPEKKGIEARVKVILVSFMGIDWRTMPVPGSKPTTWLITPSVDTTCVSTRWAFRGQGGWTSNWF